MPKIDRQAVYDKYSGHCAYCGQKIEFKQMQVDHLYPKCRAHHYSTAFMRKTLNLKGGNIDSFENLMPSCRRCNHYKRSYTLKEFRSLIATVHERIQNVYIAKVALDYGIIKYTPFKGYFYFERKPED